jgi:hypothetical protein
MALSRERAVELSHRIVERIGKTAGVELAAEREFARNHVLKALLQWDKELDRITAEAAQRVAARAHRVVEGSREWDLLLAEETERGLLSLVGRGE